MWRLAIALVFMAACARAEEAPPGPGQGDAAVSAPTDYCANFADRANDARIAWQAENIKKLETDLDAKIAILDAKKLEIQGWIERRDAMLKQAGRELVDIYAKMDPEAAALQLAKLDTATATSVLRQLSPRGASAILNVMDTSKAAGLAKAIANATLKDDMDKESGT